MDLTLNVTLLLAAFLKHQKLAPHIKSLSAWPQSERILSTPVLLVDSVNPSMTRPATGLCHVALLGDLLSYANRTADGRSQMQSAVP